LCHPVDIRIDTTIKCGRQEKWANGMLDGDGIVDGEAKEPS
jgi:hypothetical protein